MKTKDLTQPLITPLDHLHDPYQGPQHEGATLYQNRVTRPPPSF
jgi:hypothetical protein